MLCSTHPTGNSCSLHRSDYSEILRHGAADRAVARGCGAERGVREGPQGISALNGLGRPRPIY